MLIRYFLLLVFCTALLLAAPGDSPNILMIAVDDWNDWISPLGGHPQAVTPNMDRLAESGVLFTNAHTAAPICNPSRTALMVGQWPTTTGVYDNGQIWRAALPDAVTLPQYFRENGYYSAGSGKLFHHGIGSNDPPSWDEYFFWNPSARANGWFESYYMGWPDPEPESRPVTIMGSHKRNWDWAPLDVPDEEMPDHKVSSFAAEFLTREHDRPFFLGVGIFRPHNPWFVPRKYFDMFPEEDIVLPVVKEDDLSDVPPAGQKIAMDERSLHGLLLATGNYKKAVRAYLACIAFADAMLGRVLDGLEKSRYRDNTIVVLWSDHGYHLGEKWHWHKWSLWHRATHVPLIIAAPGVTEAGVKCERTVSLVDLYPTLADLAGLPAKEGLDGKSLRPLLEDGDAKWDRPSRITFGRGNHAVRSERWSYIRYKDGSEEIYDRRRDPHEWVNLAEDPSTAAVREELRKWLPEREAPVAAGRSQLTFDPATVTWTRKEAR